MLLMMSLFDHSQLLSGEMPKNHSDDNRQISTKKIDKYHKALIARFSLMDLTDKDSNSVFMSQRTVVTQLLLLVVL